MENYTNNLKKLDTFTICEKLENKFIRAGLSVSTNGSSKSGSCYIKLSKDGLNNDESITIRISDHDLPLAYDLSDFSFCTNSNSQESFDLESIFSNVDRIFNTNSLQILQRDLNKKTGTKTRKDYSITTYEDFKKELNKVLDLNDEQKFIEFKKAVKKITTPKIFNRVFKGYDGSDNSFNYFMMMKGI